MNLREQTCRRSSQLEQYCLGLLPIDEAREGEQMANEQEAVRNELEQLMLAECAEPITPSPDLKNRIMTTLMTLSEAAGLSGK